VGTKRSDTGQASKNALSGSSAPSFRKHPDPFFEKFVLKVTSYDFLVQPRFAVRCNPVSQPHTYSMVKDCRSFSIHAGIEIYRRY
jgi:hypothetical protein